MGIEVWDDAARLGGSQPATDGDPTVIGQSHQMGRPVVVIRVVFAAVSFSKRPALFENEALTSRGVEGFQFLSINRSVSSCDKVDHGPPPSPVVKDGHQN